MQDSKTSAATNQTYMVRQVGCFILCKLFTAEGVEKREGGKDWFVWIQMHLWQVENWLKGEKLFVQQMGIYMD